MSLACSGTTQDLCLRSAASHAPVGVWPLPPGRGREGKRAVQRAGRGAQVAAVLKGPSGWGRDANGIRTRARRVAVKARIVKLNPKRGPTCGRQFVSGQTVSGIPLRGGGVNWSFGRNLGLGL
jgi:hypothetical protein